MGGKLKTLKLAGERQIADGRMSDVSLADLDVVILCGGLGTRLREETEVKPKPMVEIGGRPIIWHIMKIYSRFGLRNFILCLGYKGEILRDYFLNYRYNRSDLAVDLHSSTVEVLGNAPLENWRVVLADTGDVAQTGARIRTAMKYVRMIVSSRPTATVSRISPSMRFIEAICLAAVRPR